MILTYFILYLNRILYIDVFIFFKLTILMEINCTIYKVYRD